MRIIDVSSDVCSSDLLGELCSDQGGDLGAVELDGAHQLLVGERAGAVLEVEPIGAERARGAGDLGGDGLGRAHEQGALGTGGQLVLLAGERTPAALAARSEEHTSELQSLMRSSYAVFCWKKKK